MSAPAVGTVRPDPKVEPEAAEEDGSSLWRDAWRRLKKNRAAVVSGVLLVVLVVACILQPELSHWRYDQADLSRPRGLVASNGHVHAASLARLASLFPRR